MSDGCEPYKKTIDIFTHCYETFFPVYHVDMDPEKGALILAEAHTKAALYAETKAAVKDFNIAPGEMLHVGDGENDVLGAAAIGADTV
jgi:FMN phosphatase YigB (HAD superfamily)